VPEFGPLPGPMRRPRLTAAVMLALALTVLASGISIAGGGSVSPQKAPPPTPVPPFGSPSPYPTALDTPPPSSRPPTLDAAAAALVDLDSGQVLHRRNGRARRPVASLTKIMTALLVLEATDPGDRVVASATAAAQEGAELELRRGEVQPVRQLLYALMLQSANDAAVALAEHVGGSVSGFVQDMNRRVRRLGLDRTRFASPNGLNDAGYSTALDLARITIEAYELPAFAEVAATRSRRIRAPRGEPRHIQSRNALLWLYPGAMGVKTGFTAAAGFCIVAAAERDGLRLVSVVLGSPDEAFSDGAALLSYGFEAFERRDVLVDGEEAGELRVEGQPVPVEAGRSLELLVPADAELVPTVRPAEGVALPVAEGQRVGTVVVRGPDGTMYGAVPAIAVRDVRRPPPAEVPWWDATLDRMTTFLRDLFAALL
jgi:serine-type D-Ala-D-Ala carboxypeptidase (penicillin-binding protein 5/6)